MTFYTDDLASKVIGEVNATLDATRTDSLLDRIMARTAGGTPTQTTFADARDVSIISGIATAYDGGTTNLTVYNFVDAADTAISSPKLIIDTDGDVSAYRTAVSTNLTGVSGNYTWRGVQVHGALTSQFQIKARLESPVRSFTYKTLDAGSAAFTLSGSGSIDIETGVLSSTNMAYAAGGATKADGKLRGQVAATSDAGTTLPTESVVGLFAFSDDTNGGFIGSTTPLQSDGFAVVQNVTINQRYRPVTFTSKDVDNVIAQAISSTDATRQASLVHSSFRISIDDRAANAQPLIATHGAGNVIQNTSLSQVNHNSTPVVFDTYRAGPHAALLHGVTPVDGLTLPLQLGITGYASSYFMAYTASDFTPLPAGNYKWSGVQVGPNSDGRDTFEITANLTAGNNSFAYSTILEAVSGEATSFTLSGNGVVDKETGLLTSSTMNFNGQASGASSDLRGQIAGDGAAVAGLVIIDRSDATEHGESIGFIGSEYTAFTQRSFTTRAYNDDIDGSGDGTYGVAWGTRNFKQTAITPEPKQEREIIYISQNIAQDVSATGKDVPWITTALSTDLTPVSGTPGTLGWSTGTNVKAFRAGNEAKMYFINNNDDDRVLVDGPVYSPWFLQTSTSRSLDYTVEMTTPRLASQIGAIETAHNEDYITLQFDIRMNSDGDRDIILRNADGGGSALIPENVAFNVDTGKFAADITALSRGGGANALLENGKLIGQIFGSEAKTLGGVYWGTAPTTTSASTDLLPTAARGKAVVGAFVGYR